MSKGFGGFITTWQGYRVEAEAYYRREADRVLALLRPRRGRKDERTWNTSGPGSGTDVNTLSEPAHDPTARD
jgi:hypothetical protein